MSALKSQYEGRICRLERELREQQERHHEQRDEPPESTNKVQHVHSPARQPWDSSQATTAQPGLRCPPFPALGNTQVGFSKGSKLKFPALIRIPSAGSSAIHCESAKELFMLCLLFLYFTHAFSMMGSCLKASENT